MIIGERERREDEKERIEDFINSRRQDIANLEKQKFPYKEDIDQRIKLELSKRKKINERIAQLDATVKVYQDKGAEDF